MKSLIGQYVMYRGSRHVISAVDPTSQDCNIFITRVGVTSDSPNPGMWVHIDDVFLYLTDGCNDTKKSYGRIYTW